MHEPRCGRCGHPYSTHQPSAFNPNGACHAWNDKHCLCAGWVPHPSGMDPHPRGRGYDATEETFAGESDLE